MADVKEKSVHDTLFTAVASFTPEGKEKFKAQSAKETDAEYLARLLERASELPKEQYDSLPEETVHKWFEGAAAAFNDQKPIPAPEGFTSAYKAPADKAKGGKAADGTPAPAGAAPTAPKPADSAGAPAEATAATRAPRKRAEVTAGKVIRRAVIENQTVTADEVKAKLAEAGFKDVKTTTIGSYMSDALATLQVAIEMGKFEPVPKAQAAAAA